MQGMAPGGYVLPEDQTAQKKPVLKGQAPGGVTTTITPTTPTTTATMPAPAPTSPAGGTSAAPGGILPTKGTDLGSRQDGMPQVAGAPVAGNPGVFTGPGTTPISQNMNPSQNGLYTNPGTPQQTPVAGTGPQVPSGVSNPSGGLTGGLTPAVMPGPGLSPMGPGMNPGAPQAPPNPYMTGFSPGNDLRFRQINPYGNDRLQQTQGAVDAATAALSGGPNRQQMAADLFQSYLQQSSPEFDRMIREITQRNAAGGRLGSGMYGSNLVDAATQRQRDIAAYGTQLAYDTTAGDIQDRLNNVSALAGLENQQFGQGAAQRNELRGERSYQYGVGQQAQQDAINQRLLEDQLLNSASNRDLSYYQTLGQFGFGANPAGTLGGLAGDTQNAANGASAGANDLFMQWLLSRQAGG